MTRYNVLPRFIVLPCVLFLPLAARHVQAGETIYLEAEEFKTIRGETRIFGGVPGVLLSTTDSDLPELSTRFDVPKAAEAELWLRVYFPWTGQDRLLVIVDDFEERPITARGEGKRWDKGNHQVWHWVNAGRYRLKAGPHQIKILPSGGRGQRIDAVAFHAGEAAWSEPWLSGSLSRLSASPARYTIAPTVPLLVEAEDFDVTPGNVESLSAELKAAVLTDDRGRLALVLKAAKPTKAHVWVRLFFDTKNMFEGLTMEERANAFFLSIDGQLHRTVLMQDGWRWHWQDIGEWDLTPGQHLVVLEKQGATVKVDKILFHAGGSEPVTTWIRAPYPHPLPFGMPNATPYDSAPRVSDMRAFGSLSLEAKLQWLGPVKDGVPFPVQIQLPRPAGQLVLEKTRVQPSLAPRTQRNPPQQICMSVHGDGSDTAVKVVLVDRCGERFLCTLAPRVNWQGWRLLSFSIPLSTNSSTGLYCDGTGSLADGPLNPPLGGAAARFASFAMESEGGDGIPDPPFRVESVVLDKPGNRAAKLVLGDPSFESPLDIRAEPLPEGNDGPSFKVTVTNSSETERTALVYVRVADPGRDFVNERRRACATPPYDVVVPPRGEAALTWKAKAGPGVHHLTYRVGQSLEKRLLFASDPPFEPERTRVLAAAEKRHGAFRFSNTDRPLTAPAGAPLKNEETTALYGQAFKVMIDGVDAASWDYARRMDWSHPLVPTAFDLSDGAGWPDIHVPYGQLAIDPRTGRFKFSEGRRDKLAMASVAYGGFAAPGHGPLLATDNFVVVPPGEANFTVLDVSDKKSPRVASFITSWYFAHQMHSYRNYGIYESSHRGLMLLDDLWSNPYRPGQVRSVNLNREKYGRLVHIFEKDDIAVTGIGSTLWLHDLTDVFNPVQVGSIENATGLTPTGQKDMFLTTVDDALRVIDMSDPRRPKFLDGSIPREKVPAQAKLGETKPDELAAIAAVSPEHVAFRIDKAFLIYAYSAKGKLSAEKLYAIPFPEGTKKHVFAALHRGHFYLVDGQYGPGAYSVPYDGWKSRIFTYRLDKGEPKLTDTFVDPKPTAYSQIEIHGNHAYVNDYDYGVWVFDLTNPARPAKLSGVATAEEGDGVWLNGRTAFFWQTFGGNVYSIDIRSPDNLKHLGNYWDGAWVSCTNYYRGNYVLGGKDDFVYIPRCRHAIIVVDARDPARMKEVNIFRDLEGKPVVGQGAQIHVEDNRAYVIVEGKPAKLHVFDVSSPAEPKCLATADIPVGGTLFAKGERLYVAGGTTLAVIDVKNPQAPQTQGVLDLSKVSKNVKILRGIAIVGHCAYLTDNITASQSLLHIVDIRDASQPRLVKSVDPLPDLMDAPCSSGWADSYQDVVVEGDYLFIGNYGQIECLDVSDPENPTFYDRIAIGYQWSVGLRWGEHLFVPGLAGLYAVDAPCSSQVPTGAVQGWLRP